MIIDARRLPEGKSIETEVCIIGAGAAGITLARELVGQEFQVVLLESGGFELDRETQLLYEGDNIGLPYFPLNVARLRFFGGSTNHWSNWC
ncbi:MAG: GMC family oxidoreductase, partial [Acidiferrobacterales bacterium]